MAKQRKDASLPAGAEEGNEEVSTPEVPIEETAQVEAPKVEAPKVEAPKVETSVVEEPKAEAPKVAPAPVIAKQSVVKPVEMVNFNQLGFEAQCRMVLTTLPVDSREIVGEAGTQANATIPPLG